MIKKRALSILLVIISLAAVGIGLCLYLRKPSVATNFEECTKVKGSIILQTYPRQCVTPDGKSFTEEVETLYYREPFEGVLELQEGIYYSKEEDKEKTKEEALTYLKDLYEKDVPIEKAWYFKSLTSCGMLQIIVSPKIIVKVEDELPRIVLETGGETTLLEAQGFTKVSTISQCANQSGWVFERF